MAVSVGALAGAATALVLEDGSPPAQTAGTIVERSVHSKALRGQLRYEVYLPAGYADSTVRYPVVYFLHGLPAQPYAFRRIGFLANALQTLGQPAIVVAPQGARDGDSDPEYLDWGPGRNWETAIGTELPRAVDASFRTIPAREGRAVVGISAGGYGAVLLALHHLARYSVVESWSGYFHPTNPTGTTRLDLGSARRNRRASAHSLVAMLRAATARRPTFFAFYVGEGDERFRDENERLNRELTAAGVAHVFEVYPGAHEQTVWDAHAVEWLGLALDHLARAA